MSQFIEMFKNIPSVKIADCCITVSGGTPNTKKIEYYDGGDIPWLSSGEINQGYIFSTDKYITQLGLENSSAKWVPANSVVIAMYGATAGKVGFIKIPLTTNQAVCTLLPNDGFEPLYLYYATLSKTSWMISQCRGAAQPNISQSIIRSMEIPMATIDEQKRFCKLLTQADKSKFGDFKSQFIEMFSSYQTTPVGNYIEDSYPGEWGTEDKDGNGVKVVRTTNFTNSGKLDLTDVVTRSISEKKIERKKIRKYDTILERSGGTTDNPVGRVVLFEEDEQYLCNNFTQVLRFKKVDPIFAFYSLFYFYHTNKIVVRSMGSKTTGIQNLNMSKYLEIGIPNASDDEQKKFVAIAKQADKSKSYVWIAFKNLEPMLGYCIRQIS